MRFSPECPGDRGDPERAAVILMIISDPCCFPTYVNQNGEAVLRVTKKHFLNSKKSKNTVGEDREHQGNADTS
jgi:hypothetical protein